ncbi:hypothetical protein J7J26_03325 [Candidatus Micrarchaeota archaeon]|nr:hypothetical protein [Candidatus Micrarchaeota archaeon]
MLRLGNIIKIRVKRSGMFQLITFSVVREQMQIGAVCMLKTDKKVDLSELRRVAELYNMPVKDKDNLVVPNGKHLTDFVNCY